jgi:hypothetical protein
MLSALLITTGVSDSLADRSRTIIVCPCDVEGRLVRLPELCLACIAVSKWQAGYFGRAPAEQHLYVSCLPSTVQLPLSSFTRSDLEILAQTSAGQLLTPHKS